MCFLDYHKEYLNWELLRWRFISTFCHHCLGKGGRGRMGSPVAPSSCLRATKTSGGVGVARRAGTEEIDGNGLRSMSTPPTGIWSKSLTSSGERRIRFLHATVTAPVQERISNCSSLSQLQLVEWTVHHWACRKTATGASISAGSHALHHGSYGRKERSAWHGSASDSATWT